MSNHDDLISTLNDLIETSKDGELGFRECAQRVRAPELRTAFTQRADECRRSVEELQAEVIRLGGKPDQRGSASGALHRGWVAVRGKLSGSSDEAMLNECERGEDAALARYREAAQQPLPPAIAEIVQRQLTGVQRNHDQIKQLRDRYRKAA